MLGSSGRTQWQAEKEANEQRQEPKFKRFEVFYKLINYLLYLNFVYSTPSRRYARRSFCGQSGVRRDQNDDIMFMRASSLLTRTADGTRSSTSRGSQPSPRWVVNKNLCKSHTIRHMEGQTDK